MTPEEELVAVKKELADLKAKIMLAAEAQDHFASPVYIHYTEADRKMYRHAARMLRGTLGSWK